MSTKRSRRYACFLVLLAAPVLCFSVPASASTPHACFSETDDQDGDGYAEAGSASQTVWGNNDLYCPAGWVEKGNDCNDHNAAVHPRNEEYWDNGVDDNCDAGADEPIPYYTGGGFDVTPHSFSAVVRLNDHIVRVYQQMGAPIYADVWLEPLTMSNTPKLLSNLTASYHESGLVKVNLTGLVANTPYRARFRFKPCTGICSYTNWSTYYYSTTTGYSKREKTGATMVLSALAQFNASKYQLVGYGYSLPGFPTRYPDGTRYGAGFGEKWCSEFYSWVGKAYLNWGTPPETTYEINARFIGTGGSLPTTQATWTATQGDWFGVDSDGDGSMNHSVMVLAWDQDKKYFWTIEGNSGNTVDIGNRTVSQLMAFGHLNSNLIK